MTTPRGKAPLTEGTPNGRQPAKPRRKTPAPAATPVLPTTEPGPEQPESPGRTAGQRAVGAARFLAGQAVRQPWTLMRDTPGTAQELLAST